MKDTFALVTIATVAVVMLLTTGTGLTNFITPVYAPEPARLGGPTLSGVWKSNDGGAYYMSQNGNVLWWIGMSGGNDGRTYSNVFKGTITYGNPYTIAGEWTDVPRGTNRNAGTMTLQMESYETLQKISQTGGFGPILWEKVSGWPF